MEISTAQFKRCDLVKATGRIDSSTAPILAEAFKEVNDKGQYKVVLDMSGVEYISSSGLWVLINEQKTCKRYNRGELVLASTPENIKSALDLAGFMQFFKLFGNPTEAVGNF